MDRPDDYAIGVSDRRTGRLIFTLVALGFAALAVAGGFAVRASLANDSHAGWVQHTQEVETAVARFAILVERSEAARRAYMIDSRQDYRQVWQRTDGELGMALDAVARLTADNEAQQRRLAALRPLLGRHRALAARSIAAVDGGNDGATFFRRYNEPGLIRAIRARTAEIERVEARLLGERSARRAATSRQFYWALAVSGLLALAMAAASLWLIRRYTRALLAAQADLREINVGLESAVAIRTVDLRRANEEIQRFAYIVSHDLRSPLVNVMGFTAELETARGPLLALVDAAEAEAPSILSDEARAAAREDLPEAIGFIRASTLKMDRLISSILKLSREGTRTLALEPVAMDDLIQGVADGIRHLADSAGARIEVVRPMPALIADRLAMEQIFSNLLENAVKYLKPGRAGEIVATGRRVGQRAIFEISDNGRGIDPGDHERIFDLFRRAGAQDQPGEGIGLAHVRPLVWRLGGTIEVESELDRGATFRLSLPLKAELGEDSKS